MREAAAVKREAFSVEVLSRQVFLSRRRRTAAFIRGKTVRICLTSLAPRGHSCQLWCSPRYAAQIDLGQGRSVCLFCPRMKNPRRRHVDKHPTIERRDDFDVSTGKINGLLSSSSGCGRRHAKQQPLHTNNTSEKRLGRRCQAECAVRMGCKTGWGLSLK